MGRNKTENKGSREGTRKVPSQEKAEAALWIIEQNLKQRNQYIETILNNLPIGIAVNYIDSGKAIYLNEKFTEIYGWPAEDLIDVENFFRLVYPDPVYRKKISEKVFKDIASGKPERMSWDNIKITGKDGTVKTAFAKNIPLYDQNLMISTVQDITERRKAEDALQESEQKYRLLADNSIDVIWQMDLKFRFIYVSPSVLQITGYSREEFIGTRLHQHTSGKEFKKLVQLALSELKNYRRGRHVIFETQLFKKDGKEFPVEISAKVLVNEKGKPVGYQGSVRDTTRRKEIENENLKQAEFLDRLIETIPLPLFYKNKEGQYLGFNKAFEQLIGKSRESMVGKTVFDLGYGDLARIYHKMDTELLKHPGRQTYEGVLKNSKGKLRNMIFDKATFNDHRGKVAGLIGIITDITERKKTEEQMRKLTSAVEQSPSSVVITDLEGNIEYINPKFTEITGYTSEETLGKNPRFLKSGETPPFEYQNMWRTISSGKEWRGRFHNRKKTGELFWESATISPIKDSQGKITHYIGIKEDITEKIKLEEQFQQSQKMEAIGRLAGGVAHDFNNLLTVIRGYSDLMIKGLKPDNRFFKHANQIHEAALRASSLTDQLLAFSRKQVIEPRILNLNESVKQTEKMLHRLIGEDIHLTVILDPELGNVRVDPGQIVQILLNLAVNSRDAMPRGGKLIIETRNTILDEHYTQTHLPVIPGRYIMLAVSDTGEGMDQETQSHIFEPFYTTKEKGRGTGLGLSTVYGIIKQNNGYVWVYSEPGRGTTFKIYFPLIEKTKKQKSAGQKSIRTLKGTETLLIVEDDDTVRAVTKISLESFGYKVIEAADGESALKLLKENIDQIDLAITDVIMPHIGGSELAGKLKGIKAEIKILFVSGYTDDTISHHGILRNGVNYLQKPFTSDRLAAKVREILDSKKSK